MRSYLRGFIFGVGVALILFTTTPLQAQGSVPNSTVQSIAETAQSLGALGFAVVCLGIALVLLIIGVLLFFWKVISPLLTAIIASNKARDEAEDRERETRKEAQSTSSTQLEIADKREQVTQQLRTRQAEAMERIVDKLNENDERSAKAVAAINEHTDQAVMGAMSDAKEKLEQAATHVEAAAKTIDDVVTKDHLTNELKPIREDLHEIAIILRKKGDTNPLDPATPDAPSPDNPAPEAPAPKQEP